MWPFNRKRKNRTVPTPEEVMRKHGMSEDELTRRFLEHLIEQRKNPFLDLPEQFRREVEEKYPDLLALAKRKFDKTRATKREAISKVPRTWQNLPSLVMMVVWEPFSYSEIVSQISCEAPDKELASIVLSGWTQSEEQALRKIEYLYQFADDSKLVLMRFTAPVPGVEQLIIRASFMRDTVSEVKAKRLKDLIEELSLLARARGFRTTTVMP